MSTAHNFNSREIKVSKTEVHVVAGAGAVGSALAILLAQAGHQVKVVSRGGSGPTHSNITLLSVDMKNSASLLRAIPTADAIYNCVNPPYDRWAQEWPAMAQSFLDFAETTGAVLVTCSNLYGYGPVEVPMTESLPLNAEGVKGRLRAQMWLDAKKLNDDGRIRATEIRGSDYISAGMQSRLGARVIPKILKGKSAQVLGSVDQLHTWTSPYDAARLMQIVAIDPRAWGKAWHVPSNLPKTQRQAIEDLARAGGKSSAKVSSLPNSLFWLLGVFNPLMKALRETAYQMNRTYILDDSAARKTFDMQPTPWDEILVNVIAESKHLSSKK